MHYLNPTVESAHVIIFYRNFMAKDNKWSHVGLGVNGIHTIRVLRRNRVRADLFGIWTADDISNILTLNPTCTHAVIEAPFLAAENIKDLMWKHPTVHIIVRIHSQVGFIQVEAGAVKLIRDYIHLQEGSVTFSLAVNNIRMGHFIEQTYRSFTTYLPNLYDLEHPHIKMWKPPGKLIRIGSYGCIRLQKNHSTAAAAALILARTNNHDLEFSLSVNREEHGGGVVQAIRHMFSDIPSAKLIEIPWQPWSQFRHQAANLDLHIQVSVSETFNITTADAAAEGVASVTGAAIDWVPKKWTANIDDADDVARTANWLLHDPSASEEGIRHLKSYVDKATIVWLNYLRGDYHQLPHPLEPH